MPNSYYYDDAYDGNREVGIDKNIGEDGKGTGGETGKDSKDETDKDTGGDDKSTGGETGKDSKDETGKDTGKDGKGTSDDDAAAKKKAEEDAKKKEDDDAAAKKKAEEDAAAKKKAEEDAAAKKKAEEDAKKKEDDDAAAKKKAEEDAKKKEDDDAAAKKKAEEDAKKKEDDDAAAKKKAEEDAAAKKKVEEDAKKKEDDDAAAKKKTEEDAAKKKVEEEEDANKEAGTIMPEEITLDHTEAANCGSYSGYYKSYSQVGRDGFHTYDILKALHPEMFANPKIAPHIEKGAHGQYGAVNYIFDFTSPINFSWGSPSNMLCYKCTDTAAKNHPSCQNNDTKSVCYPAGYYATPLYNNNFFGKLCPNIISESTQGNIKAKEVAPLILVNSAGQMIDKDGNNTQIYYSYLKPYLKPNGKIKDCAGDTKCKEFAEIMKKVAWETDKEVTLQQTPALKGEASSYSSSN